MKKMHHYPVHLLVSIGLLCSGIAAAAELDLGKADALLKAGKAQEGYTLLAPHEYEMAGNVDYDYLLGIAALDSDKPDKATLAFERVLAVNPNFAGARLDMARAYFALGDYERAKTEFETVLGQNPPPQAKATIEKYLTAIKQQDKKTLITGYLEGSVGYDDNVTAATTTFSSSVGQAFPSLAGQTFTPTGNALLRRDTFLALGGGLDVNYKLSDRSALYLGLDAKQRSYDTERLYDTDITDERFGLITTEGTNTYRVGMQFQQYRQLGGVAGTTNDRDSSGISVEWKHTLNERNLVSVFGLYNQQRFPDMVDAINGAHYSDIDQTLVGVNWLTALQAKGNPLFVASLSYGEDKAKTRKSTGTDVGKNYLGLRLYGQYSLDERLDIFGVAGYQWRNDTSMFDRSAVNSGVPYGEDRLSDFSVGFNWRPYPNWTVRPQVSYWSNESNLSLYSYDRTETSVTVRHDFR